jgi:hypothetical protein
LELETAYLKNMRTRLSVGMFQKQLIMVPYVLASGIPMELSEITIVLMLKAAPLPLPK